MTLETPASILAWSVDTFGERTALSVATRTSKEVNEAMCAVLNDAPLPVIHDELADCAVMMWQVGQLIDPSSTEGPYRSTFRASSDAAREKVCPYFSAVQLQRRFTTVLEELIKERTWQTSTDLGDVARGRHARQHSTLILKDSLLLLDRLAWFYAIDLQDHVDAKMRINRARSWERLNDGSYQHVKAQNGAALTHPAQ